MTIDRSTPCPNCPFRRSASLAHWAPDEYAKLETMERAEGDIARSAVFHCHKGRREPPENRWMCAGWLLDQKRKGVPSLALRLRLSRDEAGREQYASAHVDPENDLYGSVDELVETNRRADAIRSRGRRSDRSSG